MELKAHGLVLYTFGNVSEIDRDRGVIAIKPSGVPYQLLKASDIVVLDLNGEIVEGHLRPSSDTKTHLALYREWSSIGGIAHTHSSYATAWAQAKKAIPCYGTTHADYVYGDVPCTKLLTDLQVQRDYEWETGNQIIEAMQGKNPQEIPMMLVASHGPFTWGKDAAAAVYHSVILEELAKIAYFTASLEGDTQQLQEAILNKHFQRKHGKSAYYGQRDPRELA